MSEIPPYRPDPLAPGYTPAPEGAPDREHDHHVSFPDNPGSARPAPANLPGSSDSSSLGGWSGSPRLSTPTAGTSSSAPGNPASGAPSRSYPSYHGAEQQSTPLSASSRTRGPDPSSAPPWAAPGRRPSRLRTLVLVAVFAVVVPLVVVGLVVGGRSDGSADPSPKAARPTTVPNSPLAVDPTPVPRLTPDVRSVRFEVQGTGRADIRLYRDGASERIKDVTLPYAVSVPVGEARSPYLTISATDYERTDSMKCIATAGEEVVSVNVGTRRVECTVTSSSLPTTGNEP